MKLLAALFACLIAFVPAAAAPTLETLAEQLTDELAGYVNRAYRRGGISGHLVLTSNPKLLDWAGDASAVQYLTLERFYQNKKLYPVLIERTVVLAPSGGRWWVVEVRSVFRPIPEYLDRPLGPYLGDYPIENNNPPALAGFPPIYTLDGAFADAVRTWLRDHQFTAE